MRCLLILLLPTLLFAQEFEFQQEFDTIPVEIEGWQPFCPWAGGFTDCHPDLVDIDADGDLDMFVGENFGRVAYANNIGDAQLPDFEWIAWEYDSLQTVSDLYNSNPDFWDLDGDGDLDAVIGSGYVTYVENLGTAQVPDFTATRDTLYDTQGNGVFGTHVALVDLDADGDGDLIGGEWQGYMILYLNVGTPDSFAFEMQPGYWLGISIDGFIDPTFCDIDCDNDYDLFFGEEYGNIWFYLNEGDSVNYNLTYQTDQFANIDAGDQSSPEFADIDGDGDYDLFVGTEENGPFFYENLGSPILPNFTPITEDYLTLDLGPWTRSQVVDINGDDAPDLVVGIYNQLAYLENIGTSGNPNFQFIEDGWQGIYQNSIKPHFCDIDADGDYDLFCGEGAIPGPPSVALYLNRGTPQEPQLVLHDPNYITNEIFHANTNPGFTDIDADGDYDMFITDDNGHFFYYQNIGDSLTPNFTYVDSQWQGIQFLYPRDGWRGFDFVDIDDDLDYDLFTESHVDYNLCFYRNTGTPQSANMVLEIEVMFPEYSFEPIPSFVDIDLDGDQDLFCGENNGGIFFFRNVTGQNEVGPRRPEIPYPKLDFSISPNPANPVTWISFSLPAPQEATLAVYSILGAKVATLTSGLQMPGTHNIIWNASQYSSGVYIIQLETPQFTSSQRVMVVK